MRKATERQLQVLRFLMARRANGTQPPSLREISAHLGITGTNSAKQHLTALESKGYVERDDYQSRSLRIRAFPLEGAALLFPRTCPNGGTKYFGAICPECRTPIPIHKGAE